MTSNKSDNRKLNKENSIAVYNNEHAQFVDAPIKPQFIQSLKTLNKDSVDTNDIITKYSSIANPTYLLNQLLLFELKHITADQNVKKSAQPDNCQDMIPSDIVTKREILKILNRYHHFLLDDDIWFVEKNKKTIRFANTTQSRNMHIIINYLNDIMKLLKQKFPNNKIQQDYESIDSCWRNIVYIIINI